MREIRVQHAGWPSHPLYAFDSRRTTILLSGREKTGDDRGCETDVPLVDRRYDEHLAELRRGGTLPDGAALSVVTREDGARIPERREAAAERLIQAMALNERRAARALTQEHLSLILGVKHSAIAKLARRADLYVMTLRHFMEAMGGPLEIRWALTSSPPREAACHCRTRPVCADLQLVHRRL